MRSNSLRPTPHLVEHHESMSGMVADSGEPQAMRRARHEFGCRFGVAACKERDVMPLSSELLGQP